MKLHYVNDALLPGKAAHKVARIMMAEGFSAVPQIEQLHFYFLSSQNSTEPFIKSNKIIYHPTIVPKYSDEEIVRIPHPLYLLQRFYVIATLSSLFLSLKKSKDLVFIRGNKAIISLFLSNAFHKLKYAIELHNYEFGKNIFSDAIYKKVLNSAVCLVTITEHTKNNWTSAGISADKILVLPSGVDLQAHDCISTSKEALRTKLELPQNQKIVMYTGKIGKNRGIEDIVQAAQNLHQVIFVLLGEEENKDLLENAPQNVKVLGYKKHIEIPEYLKSADILLAPYSSKISTVEHMSPVKIFEYMASRTPIIVSDLPRIREIVSEKEAVFSKPDNSEELQQKIEYLLENEQKGKGIAENAYVKAQNYTWEKRAQTIIQKCGQ